MRSANDILKHVAKETVHSVEVRVASTAQFKVEFQKWFDENGVGTVRILWTSEGMMYTGVLMFSDPDVAFWARMAFG